MTLLQNVEATAPSYRDTHKWLTFELELQDASPEFWMLLGEARSKCDHLRYVPLEPPTAQRLMQIYFAKGVMATTAIEGNTLTQDQVERRMEGQLELPISKEYLGHEVDNMLAAYNGILAKVDRGELAAITPDTLSELNGQILSGLEVEDHVVPGKTRHRSVVVGPYLAPPAEQVDQLLDQLCTWLEGPAFRAPTEAQRIPFAFIKAVVAHVYIEWIHPYGDGNGRLGRLIEFLILISSGAPSVAAHILTSHYNDTRTQYYRQLAAASRNGGDLRPFLMYAAQGLVDGLVGAIKQVHRQQELLMWQTIVDRAFNGNHTPAANRQRMLAIEVGRIGTDPVPRLIATRLTPELAEAYAGKTKKTVSRDVNRLRDLELLDEGDAGLRANYALVRGMRPMAVDPTQL